MRTSLRRSLFQWACDVVDDLSDGVPSWLFLIYFVGLWFAVSYIVGVWSGWRLLAERFRTQRTFIGTTYMWLNATMRWGAGYSNVLKVGADVDGLSLAPTPIFQIGHPPLFIPWTEIHLQSSCLLGVIRFITLTLGTDEQIPFRISKRIARKLRHSAGAGWPDPQNLLRL